MNKIKDSSATVAQHIGKGLMMPTPAKKQMALSVEARILAAAEKVFAEKGLNGARIREIAELAKVPPSQVIYYYKTKENLYKTVIENYYIKVERSLYPVVMEEIPPKEKLSKMIVTAIDLLAENDHAARILLRESIDKGKYVNEVLSKPYLRELFDLTEHYVLSESKPNSQQPNETIHLITNIFGCVMMFFIGATTIRDFWKKDIYTKQMIEERKKAVLEFIFNGIGNRFE